MTARKRLPVEEGWASKSFCKGQDPGKWDLDTGSEEEGLARTYTTRSGKELHLFYKGRQHCVKDCLVRVDCLRTALTADDPATLGVVRGGILFDSDQEKKKKSKCLLCGWHVAKLEVDEDGNRRPGICWVCHRYIKCLNCTRMVRRRPGVDSYYCKYCAS